MEAGLANLPLQGTTFSISSKTYWVCLVSYFSDRLDRQNLADEARIDLAAHYMFTDRLRQLEQV